MFTQVKSSRYVASVTETVYTIKATFGGYLARITPTASPRHGGCNRLVCPIGYEGLIALKEVLGTRKNACNLGMAKCIKNQH